MPAEARFASTIQRRTRFRPACGISNGKLRLMWAVPLWFLSLSSSKAVESPLWARATGRMGFSTALWAMLKSLSTRVLHNAVHALHKPALSSLQPGQVTDDVFINTRNPPSLPNARIQFAIAVLNDVHVVRKTVWRCRRAWVRLASPSLIRA